MRNKFLLFTILFSLLGSISSPAKADDLSNVNLWARMVTSYALTFTSYMIYRKKLEMSPEDSVLLSALTGIALGFIRDKFIFKHDNIGEYMKANAIGTTASVFLTYSIQF
jgi:hypothetical protein